MKYNILLYRRQYILGPRYVESYAGWNQFKIGKRLYLTAHPELKVQNIENGTCSIALIGEVYDPFNTTLDNDQIADILVSNARNLEDLIRTAKRLSGRFIVIYSNGGEDIIFNDAAGFRQIFYFLDPDGRVWCGSQPEIIAEANQLHIDEKIREEFFKLPLFKRGAEYWYPGSVSVYRDILHLMPNHHLDLNSGKVTRFWPDRQIQESSLNRSVGDISELLKQIMTSICYRHKTALAITGGLDSRLLLAASRDVKNSLLYFTHTTKKIQEDHPDIRIPVQMLADLNLKHTMVQLNENEDEEFYRYFRRNVTTARRAKGQYAFTIYDKFRSLGSEYVVLNGVCSEIARNFYQIPSFVRLNGKILAARIDMIGSPIAIEEIDGWLNEMIIAGTQGYELLDLFYWEHRNANFCAMTYSEYDIAFESVSPMNCRLWLEKMLAVDKKYRMWPEYTLFHKIIEHLWPELLKYPINPATGKVEAINNVAKRFKFGYDLIRYVKLLYNMNRKS